MTPEELLKEVGEPTCRVSTTGIITNQTNAPLEPGLELYTADQLIAARKGLEEEIERLSERRCEICGYAEHHREHTSCLRTQLAAAQEEIEQWKNGGYTNLWKQRTKDRDETIERQRLTLLELRDQLARAEQRVAEWQPIETAPKDGSVIVVGYGRQGNFPVKVVYWKELHKIWMHYGEWEPGLENNATHWMPLPTPPKRSMEGV